LNQFTGSAVFFKARVSSWFGTLANWIALRPKSVCRSTATVVAPTRACLRQRHGWPGVSAESEPMPKATSRGKERSRSGKRPRAPLRYDVDQIAAALRHLYDRIAAEPLPRRFISLLNHLKVRH